VHNQRVDATCLGNLEVDQLVGSARRAGGHDCTGGIEQVQVDVGRTRDDHLPAGEGCAGQIKRDLVDADAVVGARVGLIGILADGVWNRVLASATSPEVRPSEPV
jgi:hypothetical protein